MIHPSILLLTTSPSQSRSDDLQPFLKFGRLFFWAKERCQMPGKSSGFNIQFCVAAEP